MRHEEHHAATKLAKVEMELWSHFHDDIHESQEARAILRVLNASYDEFKLNLQAIIDKDAKDFNFAPEKASHLADKVLHLLAEHKQQTMKHTKSLVDHIVAQGTRSSKLEVQLDKDVSKEMKEEEEEMRDEEEEDENPAEREEEEPDEEDLKTIVAAFWDTHTEFQKEFAETIKILKEDTPLYKTLMELHAQIMGDEPPSDDEVRDRLKSMNLTSVGTDYVEDENNVFRRTPQDFVEALLAIPRLPSKELAELEKAWKGKQKDTFSVLNQIHDWEGEGKVPTFWVERGIYKEEDEEGEGNHQPEGAQ